MEEATKRRINAISLTAIAGALALLVIGLIFAPA
jgi:hypothetical protein